MDRGCGGLNVVHRRTVVKNYPFLRFWSVVAIPTVYWIGIIELGILSENDDHFSLTFGQVSFVGTLVSLPSVPNTSISSGPCYIRGCTPGYRGASLGSRAMALVEEPDLGEVDKTGDLSVQY